MASGFKRWANDVRIWKLGRVFQNLTFEVSTSSSHERQPPPRHSLRNPDRTSSKMAERAPFPSNPEEFDHDERISYSKISQTYLLEDENGEEWEWLSGPSKWSKTVRIHQNAVHQSMCDRLWPATHRARTCCHPLALPGSSNISSARSRWMKLS